MIHLELYSEAVLNLAFLSRVFELDVNFAVCLIYYFTLS